MLSKQTFVSQLKQLIEIPTVSGNKKTNKKILDLISSWAPKECSIQRYKNNGAEILLLSTEKKSYLKPSIGYLVHADVVSAKPKMWDMNIEDHIAKGRGVSDMKYAIPIGLSLLRQQLKNKMSITIAITTDEELGGFNGAKYLAEELKFQPKILIVPDGGDNWKFIEKEKGFLRLEVRTYGKSAHGSQPWLGKSAISALVKVLTKIDEHFAKNNASASWNTTCNIGIIQGGNSVNQVSDHAWAMLDIRHPESESKQNIQNTILEIAKQANIEIELVRGTHGHSRYTPHTHPIAQKFIQTMQKHAPKKIEISKSFGASDARHFSIYDIPVLMMKPNGGDIHQDTEWINIEECLTYTKGLSEFISKVE